jgi:hypothetical protein
VVGRPEVLPAIAFVVAVAAALLLVLKSPFPWPMIGLILLGHFFLFEYSVMARNYGIAMLVLFAVATYYPAYRSRGIVLGVLLFLLANCNVFSAILAGAFLPGDRLSLVAIADAFAPSRSSRPSTTPPCRTGRMAYPLRRLSQPSSIPPWASKHSCSPRLFSRVIGHCPSKRRTRCCCSGAPLDLLGDRCLPGGSQRPDCLFGVLRLGAWARAPTATQ